MKIAILLFAPLLLVSCGESAKAAPAGVVVAAAGNASEWSNRGCRCTRSDRRGCGMI